MSKVATVCFALLWLASLTSAQQSSPSAVSAPALAAMEGRIKLDVVVTDKSGKPVSGLELKDFSLLDNNQAGRILSFQAIDGAAQPAATGQAADSPVKVILLLDTVNTGFQQVAAERQEIGKFLRQKGGQIGQPMSIYLFTDDGLKFQSEPSVDGNVLARDLDQVDGVVRTIGNAQGAAGEVDRVLLSIRNLDSIAQTEANKPGRKILIWVGPGWPLLDSPRFRPTSAAGSQQLFDSIVELSTSLREGHIALYSISEGQSDSSTFVYQDFLKGVKSADKAAIPNLGLKVLSVQSGGRVLPPSNDLAAEIASCVQDAGAFYVLSFDPPRADRSIEYHDLKVVIDRPGLKTNTTAGYYNRK